MSNARDTAKNLKTGLNVAANGDIIDLQKDGTSVGSIGTYGGDMTVGTGDTRVRFIDSLDCVVPVSDAVGTSRDASVDLGYSSIRYKDLYLSGGVYLGGTGAANHLDDYEEGTWNLTDGSGAGLSLSVISNVYTKVGRLVVASANVLFPSTSNTSLARFVLPFTADPNGSATGGVVTEDNYSSSQTLTAAINYSNGVIFRTHGVTSLTNSQLSGKRIRFTVTYHHG